MSLRNREQLHVLLGGRPAVDGGVRAHAVAERDGLAHVARRLVEHPVAVDGLVVHLAHAVEVHDEREPVGRRDAPEGPVHEQAVGAHVDEAALGGDAVDDLVDLLVDHRLAAGDVHDRRAGLLGDAQALLDLHPLVEHVLVLADAPAAVAGEVADLEGLEHQGHGEPLGALDQPLLDEVGRHAELERSGTVGHVGRSWRGRGGAGCSHRRYPTARRGKARSRGPYASPGSA